MHKSQVIEQVRAELQDLFQRLKRASDTARHDATDEESRARSKYDTQGLEASYLAAGQAERAEEVAALISTFNTTPFPPFTAADPISEGALVETVLEGEVNWFLLAPCAGGMTVRCDGAEVTVLGPKAPLRRQLVGLKTGARLKQPKLLVRTVA